MPEYRQLLMITDLSRPLPEYPLPEGMTVHAADGHERASYNWIIRASFDPMQDYNLIADDPTCAPERVFFTRLVMDIATAPARLMPDGTGVIHMVGAHPWYQGLGAARYCVLAAMKEIPVRMVGYGGSNYNISLLVKEEDKERALQALSKQLFA